MLLSYMSIGGKKKQTHFTNNISKQSFPKPQLTYVAFSQR